MYTRRETIFTQILIILLICRSHATREFSDTKEVNLCTNKSHYQLPDDIVSNFHHPNSVVCPPGYQDVFDQCYQMIDGTYTPGEAQSACQANDGVVAEVKDDVTNGAVYLLSKATQRTNYTIIGVLCGDTCRELTTYGGTPQSFTAWSKCEPNYDNLENYVVTNFRYTARNDNNKAMWNNVRNDSKLYQVACQIKSACPAVSYTTHDDQNLTFELTDGGAIAHSGEKCPDGEPKARRRCDNYSSFTAFWESWDQVIFTNCSMRKVPASRTLTASKKLVELAATDIDSPEFMETLETVTNERNTSVQITENVITAIDMVIHKLDQESSNNSSRQQFVQNLERQLTNLQRTNVGPFNTSTDNLRVQTFQFEPDKFVEELEEAVDRSVIGMSFPSDLLDFADITDPDFGMDRVAFSLIEYLTPALFASDRTEMVVSNIIGIVLEGREVHGIREPIKLTIPIENSDNMTGGRRPVYTCAYWDFDQADWSSGGCVTAYVTANSVECHCNHLTNFGVLLHESENLLLDHITMIGCLLSIGGLGLTLLFFIVLRRTNTKLPQRILTNLTLALFGFYLAFLFGIERKQMENKRMENILCTMSAASIHYMALASMCWMTVEAFHMYLLFVKVSKSVGPRFLWISIFFAWGLPVLPVAVSLAVWQDGYVAEACCYLNPDASLPYGFLPVMLLLFFSNLFCFTRVAFRLVLSKEMGSAKSVRRLAVTRVLNAVAVWTLLGMSWGFGFLGLIYDSYGVEDSMNIFDILFCLTLSVKGFLIFLLFCVGNMEFRDSLRRKFISIRRRRRQSYNVNELALPDYSLGKTIDFTTAMQSNPTCSTNIAL